MSGLRHTEQFWDRVHSHLDARRDPLEDPDVQTSLLDHPELLQEFSQLQAGLRHLAADTGRVPARHETPVRRSIVAAALILVLGALWGLGTMSGHGPAPVPDLAEDARVLACELRTVITGPGVREERRTDFGYLTHGTTERLSFRPSRQDASLALSLDILTTRRYSE